MGGRGGGPAWPPSCSQPTRTLPPAVALGRAPDPGASRGPQSGRPNRAAGPREPLLARAVLRRPPRHSTCSRLSREEAGSSWTAPPMGARRPPPRARIRPRRGAGPRALEPAKRGDRNAPRIPRRPPAAGWMGLKASCRRRDRAADQRCGSWRRVRPGVAYFERKLPSLSAQALHQPKRDDPSLWNSCK